MPPSKRRVSEVPLRIKALHRVLNSDEKEIRPSKGLLQGLVLRKVFCREERRRIFKEKRETLKGSPIK